MGRSYHTIAFHAEKCNGCQDCVMACSQAKAESSDPRHSRIRICGDPAGSEFGLALCRQCAQPYCVMNCPSGALS